MNQYEQFAYDRDWYYHKNNVRPISEDVTEEIYNSGKIVWVDCGMSEPFAFCRSDGYPDRDWAEQKRLVYADNIFRYRKFYA